MPRRSSQLSAIGYSLILATSAAGRILALWLLHGLTSARVPLFVLALNLLVGSAASFALMQRLWTRPQWLSPLHLLRVGLNGALLLASLWLSLHGVRQLGALLTVLAEMSELLVARVLFAAAGAGARREQAGGLVCMCLGYCALLAPTSAGVTVRSRAAAFAAHFAAVALSLAREQLSRRLSLRVGGQKRLHALVHACALALCAPAALWAACAGGGGGGQEPLRHGWAAIGAASIALAALLFVTPFYARALAQHAQLPSGHSANVLAASAACAALILDVACGPRSLLASPLATAGALLVLGGAAMLRAQPASPELALLLSGTGAASGLAEIPALARAARAARARWHEASALLLQAWARRSTRKLLLFLLLSAAFTLVEAALGRASSSLSLVSDACHMLLDCSGLAIGIFGELASSWQPSATFTYGHSRHESLCTFANALLLLLTAATLSEQAVGKLVWGGAPVNTARLLPVAVVGLCVNVLGICLFAEHHMHFGAQPCAGCSDEGGRGASPNMAAVLVHIAADALGSLGVIVSSLLIRAFGWAFVVRAERPRTRTRGGQGRGVLAARHAARSRRPTRPRGCPSSRPRRAPLLSGWSRTRSARCSSPRSSQSARGRSLRSRRRCCCSARPTCWARAGATRASRSSRRYTASRYARSRAAVRLAVRVRGRTCAQCACAPPARAGALTGCPTHARPRQAVTAHAFWMLTSRYNVGTLSLRVSPGTAAAHVLNRARQIAKTHGIDALTVEVEQAPRREPGDGCAHADVSAAHDADAPNGAALHSAGAGGSIIVNGSVDHGNIIGIGTSVATPQGMCAFNPSSPPSIRSAV